METLFFENKMSFILIILINIESFIFLLHWLFLLLIKITDLLYYTLITKKY